VERTEAGREAQLARGDTFGLVVLLCSGAEQRANWSATRKRGARNTSRVKLSVQGLCVARAHAALTLCSLRVKNTVTFLHSAAKKFIIVFLADSAHAALLLRSAVSFGAGPAPDLGVGGQRG